MLGFVVAVPSSPRNLTLERAKELMKMVPPQLVRVVVTVFKSASHIVELYNKLKPDFIQVHGLPANIKDVMEAAAHVPIIRAINVTSSLSLEEFLLGLNLFKALHVDSYAPGVYGGTGIIHDWSISRRIRDLIYPKPLILAGGLKPENVCEAILAVKPFAVDVSSGVEDQPGVKDRSKIISFIEKVRMAESLLNQLDSQ